MSLKPTLRASGKIILASSIRHQEWSLEYSTVLSFKISLLKMLFLRKATISANALVNVERMRAMNGGQVTDVHTGR